METSTILMAFGLTIFAGLSTGIGSVMSFFSKKFNPKFLAGALGFSAGVMIYVSMIEIFVKARDSLSEAMGSKQGYIVTTIAFFGGIALIAIIFGSAMTMKVQLYKMVYEGEASIFSAIITGLADMKLLPNSMRKHDAI